MTPKETGRIDCDEGGIDDLCIFEQGVLIRLERMDTGSYWMKVGNHVFQFFTKRNAHIRGVYRNEDTGHEAGFENKTTRPEPTK